MQQILQIFKWKKQQKRGYQLYLNKSISIDPREYPKELLKDLADQKRLQKFIEYVNKKCHNGIKLLRKLILVHLCLIYNYKFCQPFQKIHFRNYADDQWLNKNVLQPYFHLLQKICCSQELYYKVNTSQILQISYEFMFFLIKLMKDLLLSSKNINNLFLYYKIQSGIKYPNVVDNFVFITAYHSQIIYNLFKANLGQILRYPNTYIKTQQNKRIIKFILKDDLPLLNEQIKQLILNKFFCPFKKGISVKLFEIQFLSDETIKFINELFQIKQSKKMIKKASTLKQIIFDRKGKFNSQILVQMSLRKIKTAKDIMKKRISIDVKQNQAFQQKQNEKMLEIDEYLQSCKNLYGDIKL